MLTEQQVQEVVDSFAEIADRDGGSLTLALFDEGAGLVQLNYSQGNAEECTDGSCAIPPTMMENLIREGLRAHGLEIPRVEVAEQQEATDNLGPSDGLAR